VTAAKLAISTVLVTRLMVAAVARRAAERDYMVRVERID